MVVHDLEREVGNIDHHISVAEVARQPAPALHVGHHAIDGLPGLRAVDGGERLVVDHAGRLDVGARLNVLDGVEQLTIVNEVVCLAGNAQPLAQQRHARVLVSRLDRRAVGDAVVGLGGAGAGIGAQRGELVLEFPEGLLLRIEAVEGGVDVVGAGDLLEDVGRVGRVIAVVDLHEDARRRDAAGLKLARECQHRTGEVEVGAGKLIGAGSAVEVRHRIIGGVEPVGGRILKPGDDRPWRGRSARRP